MKMTHHGNDVRLEVMFLHEVPQLAVHGREGGGLLFRGKDEKRHRDASALICEELVICRPSAGKESAVRAKPWGEGVQR